jgi:hypothetical protein
MYAFALWDKRGRLYLSKRCRWHQTFVNYVTVEVLVVPRKCGLAKQRTNIGQAMQTGL